MTGERSTTSKSAKFTSTTCKSVQERENPSNQQQPTTNNKQPCTFNVDGRREKREEGRDRDDETDEIDEQLLRIVGVSCSERNEDSARFR
jgi:hypothetical protein